MFWGSHLTPPFLVYRTSPPEAPLIEPHYTPKDLAQIFKCHEETVRRMCDRGDLKSVRWGTTRRIPESAVHEYLEGGNVVRFKRKAG
jgi:excisionase family DNA binding protein